MNKTKPTSMLGISILLSSPLICLGHFFMIPKYTFATELNNFSPIVELAAYSSFLSRSWILALIVIVLLFLVFQIVYRYRQAKTLDEDNNMLKDLLAKRTTQLQSLEEQYLYLIDHSLDGMLIIQEGRIILINKQVPKILELSEDELRNKGLFTIIAPQQQDKARTIFEKVIQDGNPHCEEYCLITPKGEKIDIYFSIHQIEYQGKPAIQVFLRDVTERNQLQQQLLAAHRVKVLGTLAQDIAHNLNERLTTIVARISELLKTIPQNHKYSSELKKVHEASYEASKFTNQLLSFSKKGKFNPQILNLNNVIVDAVSLLKRTFPPRINIILHQESKPYLVYADPIYIHQLLIELFVNSLEAIPQNGTIEISSHNVELDEDFCRVHREISMGKYFKVTVADTGQGMTPEVQSLMFEPFYTTKGMSSGMGLKIAQDIVNSHRGHFLVESQVRKGTKIDVLFPAIEKKEKAIITKTIDIKGHGSILVVDDATMVVDVIKSILEERGYYVKTTTQSKEALAIFAKNPNDFDLALIDVEQPILSGTELYLEMKKIKPDFKVVFFSGGAVDPLIKESWDDGVIDFFQKPFNYDTLALVVHKAMAKVRLGKPNQDGQL